MKTYRYIHQLLKDALDHKREALAYATKKREEMLEALEANAQGIAQLKERIEELETFPQQDSDDDAGKSAEALRQYWESVHDARKSPK